MMTNERAKQILASYGGKPEQWPIDEQFFLQQLLLSNTDLQILQQQELQLDEQFVKMFSDIKVPDTQLLEQTILASLPNKKIASSSQVLKTFTRRHKSLVNKIIKLFSPTGIITTVTLVMLLTIGVFHFNYESPTMIASSMDDELLLMAEALDNSDDIELLAVLEPELFEDSSDMI